MTNNFNYGKKVMVNAARITEYNTKYVTLHNGKTTSKLYVKENKYQIKMAIRKECMK